MKDVGSFKGYKWIKGMLTIAVIMIAIIIIGKPTDANAAENNDRYVSTDASIQLDGDHSIYIYVTSHVYYGYDEGSSGWIDDVVLDDIQGGVASDNVYIDTLQCTDYGSGYSS